MKSPTRKVMVINIFFFKVDAIQKRSLILTFDSTLTDSLVHPRSVFALSLLYYYHGMCFYEIKSTILPKVCFVSNTGYAVSQHHFAVKLDYS